MAGAAQDRPVFRPVTAKTLADLDRFSHEHGKFRYCSCMRWRLTSTEYKQSTKSQRVAELTRRVQAGIPVGVLAYKGGRPVGWCSIAPRDTLGALERYRGLARIDTSPVWSVVCFFVDREVRRGRITLGLLQAAVAYAGKMGAEIVEGYPVEPGKRLYTYMGSPRTFVEAGFHDVTPAGRARRVVRKRLQA